MKRVLFDLNVLLDVLLDRVPHAEPAIALWAAIEKGDAEGLIAGHAVTTLHDLAGRAHGAAFADRCVRDVLSVFSVAAVDEAVVTEALSLGWQDFEDAVSSTSAVAARCHMIATRDPRGFKASRCPALSPVEALAVVRASQA